MDAAAIQAIYAPVVRDTAISFEIEPPSVAEMAERIAATLPIFPYLVLAEAEEIVGYAYAGRHASRAAYRWSADVSIYVASGAHRTGGGRQLHTSLLGILRRQGFHRAFAGIALPNDASVGLHEALGFRAVGVYEQVGYKHGAWRDVGYWQISLSDGEPGEVVPFADLA